MAYLVACVGCLGTNKLKQKMRAGKWTLGDSILFVSSENAVSMWSLWQHMLDSNWAHSPFGSNGPNFRIETPTFRVVEVILIQPLRPDCSELLEYARYVPLYLYSVVC